MHIKQSLQLDEHARCTHIPDEQADGRTDGQTEGQVETGMYVHIRVAGTLHVAHLSLPRAACVVCPKIPLSLGLAARVGGQLAAPFPLPLLYSPLCLSLLLSASLFLALICCACAGQRFVARRTRFAQEISEGNQAVTVANFNYLECVCICVRVCA